MIKHICNSTPVELKGQQLYFAGAMVWSSVGRMNMGKRLKLELQDRGMSPTDLCEMVPDLSLGTLSAIYIRDSKNSTYAPAIAEALGLELRWLITGDLPKYKLGADIFSNHRMTEREANIKEIERLLRNEINDLGVKAVLRMAQGAAQDFPLSKQTQSFQ